MFIGADESTLSSVGHYLSGKELLALPDILQECVMDSLKTILNWNAIGDTHTTIEEVQSLLHSLEQHEVASSLRKLLDLGKHIKANGWHRHHRVKEEFKPYFYTYRRISNSSYKIK